MCHPRRSSSDTRDSGPDEDVCYEAVTCRTSGRSTLIRVKIVPVGLLIVNLQHHPSLPTALQRDACQLLDSYTIFTTVSQNLYLFVFPRIPRTETLVAHLWARVSHFDCRHALPNENFFGSEHGTFRLRSLKHRWDCSAVSDSGWSIWLWCEWNWCCFGASNNVTRTSHSHKSQIAPERTSVISRLAGRQCASSCNGSRARHSYLRLCSQP